MQTYIETAILGVVQGLTEFIPISSSGHLVLVREVFGFKDQGLAFDAALHLATALAVLIYFREDWKNIFTSLFSKKINRTNTQSRRLLILIAVTTIPAIGVGLLFADTIEAQFRTILPVASLMIFTGLIFLLVEKIAVTKKDLTKLSFFDALSIGLAQAVAILPGISRSGATIVTGMYHGLKRETAARYSFLAATPIIVLAGFYSLWQLGGVVERITWDALALGFLTAFVSGILAVHLLLSFLKNNRLYIFAGYLIVIGVGLLAFHFFI
jgi:undecaprenyl-diphosphatase